MSPTRAMALHGIAPCQSTSNVVRVFPRRHSSTFTCLALVCLYSIPLLDCRMPYAGIGPALCTNYGEGQEEYPTDLDRFDKRSIDSGRIPLPTGCAVVAAFFFTSQQ